MAFVWPNGSRSMPSVSSAFGPRKATITGASSNHMGTDFVGFDVVRSVAAGRVVLVGWATGWAGGGYMVWVQHDGFLSRYLHGVDRSDRVRVGDWVQPGADLMLMGATSGTARLGKHLHLEIVYGGRQVDPVPFLRNRIASTAGSGSAPVIVPPKEVPLSAAEVKQITDHVTAEANRVIRELPSAMLVATIPSYQSDEKPPTLGKLIRSLFQKTFTQRERNTITTGFEQGTKLVRYAKSDVTGSVFALYEDALRKYRFHITDPAQIEALGDVLVVEQSFLWTYDVVIAVDFVESHPGRFAGYAKSGATGNVFELYESSQGNRARYLITDEGEIAALGDVPVVAQATLWEYAPINQP